MPDRPLDRLVAVGRGLESSPEAVPRRGPAHEALGIWVGRWINRGHTLDPDGRPDEPITTSDVYEWAPGGFFLVHTAHGLVGDFEAGAIEIIGVDPTGGYRSHLFDSQGNVTTHRLTSDGDTWTYQGGSTRATVVFDPAGRVQTVTHERTDDGETFTGSMHVVLTRIT